MRLALLTAAALLATPALADGMSSGADLIGTSWRLQSLTGAAVPVEVETTLQIRADGIGGKGGCNTYGGNLETRPGGIAFTQVFSTMMACADPAMQQEQNWFKALENTGTYRLEGQTLKLDDSAGNELATLTQLDS